MPVIAGLGRVLIQFGLIMFVSSLLLVMVFYAYGVPVPQPLVLASRLFPIVGISSAVLGVLGTVGRAFIPQVAQWAGYAFYLALFVPAVTAIATLISSLVSMMPLPSFIGVGIASTITGFSGFAMYYYIVTRVSGVPVE